MTDKVQKIKEWISKQQDGLMDVNGNFEYPEHEGAYHILCNLDTYIDSMQEEPVNRTPADVESAMQEVEEKARVFTEAHQGEDTDTILAQMRDEEPVSKDYRERYKRITQSEQFKKSYEGMSVGEVMPIEGEEPVSEDLEEAMQHNAPNNIGIDDLLYWRNGFIAGAKWQKAKDESTTEDLGDYINKLSKQFPEVSFAKLSRIAVRVTKWQNERIMKEAVDVEVKVGAGGYPYIPQMELYNYDKDVPLAKEGDKYKVVLIKED